MIGNYFFSNSGAAAYEIEQSLRFDGSSTYLERTPSSTGNRQKATISFWIKLSKTAAMAVYRQANRCNFRFNINGLGRVVTNTSISSGTNNFQEHIERRRDYSAWYHVLHVIDTTQSTSTNRVRTWFNNVEENNASWSFPSQNFTTDYNSTEVLRIGYDDGEILGGYLAEFHWLDGQVIWDPGQFGEYDDNGVWRPIEYTGGNYGTNGFYLKFDPSATNGIGHDHSGNGNNFTATGFTVSGTGTDVMSDTPTTNWCTLNPLIVNNSTYVDPAGLSEGNLVASQSSVPYNAFCTGTFKLPSSGKWYWEVKQNAAPTAGVYMGIGRTPWDPTSDQSARGGMYAYKVNGDKYKLGTASSYGSSWTNGDIVGVAVDMDNTTISFYKNGTSQGNAFTDIDTAYDYVPMTWGDDPNRNIWVYNFGQRAFEYTVPSGYKALNTANLPAPDIADGSDYFNTVLYTGDGTSSRAITGMGFQADFLWLKPRSTRNHSLVDVLRGTNHLQSNNTNAEASVPSFDSFDSDGFTVTADGSTNPNWNESPEPNVVWGWLANGSGSSNTDGSITSTVSANTTAGFSIVSWSATLNSTSANTVTIGHGLGIAPDMIIQRPRNTSSTWQVYHSALGTGNLLMLNNTNAVQTAAGCYPSVTSTVWTPGDQNYSGGTYDYINYCFAEVEGYSKFGSYTGNGSSDGPFVTLNFKPRWLMIKRSDSTESWLIFDSKRETYNPTDDVLWANLSNAESANYTPQDFLSNGFKIRTSSTSTNASGGTYIYAAFAEHPLGGDGISPATAR